jgi:hypothetical protein
MSVGSLSKDPNRGNKCKTRKLPSSLSIKLNKFPSRSFTSYVESVTRVVTPISLFSQFGHESMIEFAPKHSSFIFCLVDFLHVFRYLQADFSYHNISCLTDIVGEMARMVGGETTDHSGIALNSAQHLSFLRSLVVIYLVPFFIL